jgi:hypothetical protein
MKYIRDLVIAGCLAVRFKRHWYMGKQCYALMLTEEEFDELQEVLDRMVKHEH